MAPDDLMVYTGTAIVPAVTGVACSVALRAVYFKSLSVLASCVAFVVALVCGMVLSFAFVSRFSYLLHGDGALAIVAAPLMGAMLTVPIALVFVAVLIAIRPKRDGSR